MRIDNVTVWTGEPGCAPTPCQTVALDGARIVWVGATADAPGAPGLDGGGRLLTPGLIDCHTHLVHAGHRGDEFAARMAGQTYAQISAGGGGIMASVRATRAATVDQLVAQSLPRLNALRRDGVTTVEIKSGYGLDQDTELRMLQVARGLAASDMTVRTSFLGAHAVPPDYRGRADAYLDQVCLPALRAAHQAGLVDAVDAFCEGIAFSPDLVARLFGLSRALGLPVKLHAEQLSPLGGAALAAAYGALSADHLEYATDGDVRAMAAAGTVAVLLPGAYYALRERQAPPVAALRAHGVPMAVATDLNPGSSPLASPLLAMNMACMLFGLTVDESLAGMTRVAARALGLTDRGRIAPGLRADLCLWDADGPAELIYRMGFPALNQRFAGGLPC